MTKTLLSFWGRLLMGIMLLSGSVHARPYLINAQQADNRTRPQYIKDHFAWIDSLLPFDGMVVRTDSGWNIMNGVTRTYTDMTNEFAPLNGLVFTRLKHNFAIVSVDRPADLFDNWSVTIENFRVLARVLKEKGFEGIIFDNEEYARMLWNYPDNVSYPSKTLTQYQDQSRLVGRTIMQAMVGEFPSLVIIACHGPYSSFAGTPDAVRYQQTSSSVDELRGPFTVGLMEGKGSLGKVVDGGEVYGYRTATDFKNSYTFRKYTIALDSTNCPFIPSTLRPLWSQSLSISYGVYNLPFPYWVAGVAMNPTIMRSTLENALRACDDYVWLYFEGLDWNTSGGISQDWVTAVTGAKNAVGTTGASAPLVTIMSPASGSLYTAPVTINFTATASDPDGSIAKVEFMNGTTMMGAATVAPFTYSWVNPANGSYSITAKATDNSGLSTTSSPMSVTVGDSFVANINFQTADVTPPTGYAADTGALYGARTNGMTYGWNADSTQNMRNRGGNADVRLATLCQVRNTGVWEIAVPNGSYSVTVGIGDGTYPSTHTINVEGVSFWNATATTAGQFLNLTKTVSVTDGKLSIDNGASAFELTRLDYVTIGAQGVAPSAPTGMAASATSSSAINVTWVDNSTNETGFKLERSTASDFSGATLIATLPAGVIKYADTGLTAGATYYYRLSAYNATGASGYATSTATTQISAITVPNTPTGVNATAGNGTVTVNWAATPGATGYSLKRSTTSGSGYTTIASPASATYTDASVTNGTPYYYVVSATNSSGSSSNSAQVSATPKAPITIPAAPTGLSATAGLGKVSLAWGASTGATSYTVKRSSTSGGPYTAQPVVTTAAYTDSTVTANTTYYYVVSASNTAGSSANSSQVSAKPTSTVSFSAKVNFQATGITPPTGYVADLGDTYATRNGLTYGWNVAHLINARNRGGNTDIRLATLIQMRNGGIWEIAVPNGTYSVTVGVGDPTYPSVYTINVEGINYWKAANLGAGQFGTLTKNVKVSDGKLTLDQGAGAWEATRIDYVLVQSQ